MQMMGYIRVNQHKGVREKAIQMPNPKPDKNTMKIVYF